MKFNFLEGVYVILEIGIYYDSKHFQKKNVDTVDHNSYFNRLTKKGSEDDKIVHSMIFSC